MRVALKKLDERAVIPAYKTPGAAAFDLTVIETLHLEPGESGLAKTGLAMEVPEGHYLFIQSRSGFGFNGKSLVESGIVDSDYRGEIRIICKNLTPFPVDLLAGTAIAQGVIVPCLQVEFHLASDLSDTRRGAGGFGSTDNRTLDIPTE